jgi:predicted HicB family RNase H-like nuclease
MLSKDQNLSQGGARKGAGRKPKGRDRRKTLSVRIEPQTLKLLSLIAKKQGKSMGVVIDETIGRLHS